MENLLKLDKLLFININSFSGQSHTFDAISIFLAEYLIFVMAGLILLFLLYRYFIQKNKSLIILAELVIAAGLARSFKVFFQAVSFRPRPASSINIEPLIKVFDAASFPSGHTLVAFALASIIFFYNRKFSLILTFLSLLIGLARIYTGVHFPLDILAGMILGSASAVVVHLIFKKIKAR